MAASFDLCSTKTSQVLDRETPILFGYFRIIIFVFHYLQVQKDFPRLRRVIIP